MQDNNERYRHYGSYSDQRDERPEDDRYLPTFNTQSGRRSRNVQQTYREDMPPSIHPLDDRGHETRYGTNSRDTRDTREESRDWTEHDRQVQRDREAARRNAEEHARNARSRSRSRGITDAMKNRREQPRDRDYRSGRRSRSRSRTRRPDTTQRSDHDYTPRRVSLRGVITLVSTEIL